MAGQITIQSQTITGETGSKIIGPLTVNSSAPVLAVEDVAFGSATSVTVTSPAGATCAVGQPPTGNQIGLTLKGVSGDTGIPLNAGMPFLITFGNPTVTNTFVLTSAGAITGNVEINFM